MSKCGLVDNTLLDFINRTNVPILPNFLGSPSFRYSIPSKIFVEHGYSSCAESSQCEHLMRRSIWALQADFTW